jgi:hypothetical protein
LIAWQQLPFTHLIVLASFPGSANMPEGDNPKTGVLKSPYERYEDLFSHIGQHRFRPNPDYLRIQWPAFGSVFDVAVLDDLTGPRNSPQRPLIGHEVENMPITIPPISSITVSIWELDEWHHETAMEHSKVRDECPGYDFPSCPDSSLAGPCGCPIPEFDLEDIKNAS